ncbi:MAG TPA: NADH-dependent [FeFe] hydrogenase, group A6 [Methylomusa anaerophila]|uniref:NADP-reducing hydrogenase subunit HndC n=1 Tax=Methylomusa anaerophila TaxID=1930071 RepID=A0A348AGI4_9FIRM|nr:NADH-dependent [FeFe] hydrogenase, group A6 [Methylomusa anaerophila]BBB90182.1 NADP-reducing hydrogenase subunit HndC [Methylomusa anaerophila]HML88092.1 NADH-dependent [FeFe] hydrogenase, group A6 [Methylomusa anaerophila]
MITLTIDNQTVTVKAGSTILEAAQKAGFNIPTLCYLKDINVVGACRICVVEVQGARTLIPACVAPVDEGMVVRTATPAVIKARKFVLELILSDHPMECLKCVRNQNCELQKLAEEFGVTDIRFEGAKTSHTIDDSSPAIQRDPRKCILCRRCISVCGNIQTVNALTADNKGFDAVIAPAFNERLANMECVQCGQCSLVCPTGAIQEKNDVDKVWAALADPNKHVIVQTAPSVRLQIGEIMGAEPGSIVTGQMVAGLRRLGFHKVFDTNFSADVTVMEEGNELLRRINTGDLLPMITSCSPGWVKFIEHFYPDLLPHLSTCKSPQQMFGALAKTYYAKKVNIDPANIVCVSVMPCTAKKFECSRPEMFSSGYQDVDVVLTTRELGRMFKQARFDVINLPEEEYDAPLGITTGAGQIFGASGGVMEATLRTVCEMVTGKELKNINFTVCRGLAGVKEATLQLGNLQLKVAIINALGNARKVLEKIRAGEADYHFIEVMACPGGCIGGGGGPIPTSNEIRLKRIDAIYTEDAGMVLRKSHDNPAIKKLYAEFLEKPLSDKSHELLHTHYTPRNQYPKCD